MTTHLHYSETESRRFGLRVVRTELEDLDPDEFQSVILEDRSDVVIGRIPAEHQHQLALLDQIGFPWISADTLVYYYADLDRHEPRPPRNQDLEFTQATVESSELLESLVTEIFPDYTNHYYSNPYLDRTSILTGYVEWAVGYIGGPGAETTVWIASRQGTPVAFATCRYGPEESEGVLYGVRPQESGKGVYGDLIRFTLADSKARGLAKMKVSTQVQNFAVQAAWVRQGFVMRRAVATFHVNSMLTSSRVPVVAREVVVPGTEGPLGRIVDSEMVGLVSGLTAGPVGLVGVRHTTLHQPPPSEKCTVRISLPRHPDPQILPAVTELIDGNGTTCHLAYYEYAAS
ncbi:MAG: GNAT family N-acetyltransferase [Actinobacteria bacterium]|nr:GNAT family N-acetyltransferase [Actinomycetota bacterium]MBU1492461.1 GNAT family N-acetyltransferase [Actinomycetota bacterium]